MKIDGIVRIVAGILVATTSGSQMLHAQTNLDQTKPPPQSTQTNQLAAEPGHDIPLVNSEGSLDQLDVVRVFDTSGNSTINWNYSAVHGKYEQTCLGLEGKGEILGAKSLSFSTNGNQPVFIIQGDFFVKLDNATNTNALSSEKVQAVMDKVIWKSEDGKSRILLAHGTAFMLFGGQFVNDQPTDLEMGDVLAPNIDTTTIVPAATDSGTTTNQTGANKQQSTNESDKEIEVIIKRAPYDAFQEQYGADDEKKVDDKIKEILLAPLSDAGYTTVQGQRTKQKMIITYKANDWLHIGGDCGFDWDLTYEMEDSQGNEIFTKHYSDKMVGSTQKLVQQSGNVVNTYAGFGITEEQIHENIIMNLKKNPLFDEKQ